MTPVRASATLLVAIRHHLRLARRLPALAPDVSLRIAELVKVYNARACQLVLGAGAMRSSGLRSITARHLALAHRSLRVALAATRAARDALEPLVPESRRDVARREFDRAAADLSAHEAEIRAKLVAIMRDRVPFHARRLLRAVDAEMKGEGDANGGADGNEGGSDGNEGGVDGNEGEADGSRAESDGNEGGADRNRGESESSSDGSRAFAPMDFASGLRSEIGTLRRVVAGALSRRDAKTVFRAVAAALDESAADALEASIPSPPKDAVARARVGGWRRRGKRWRERCTDCASATTTRRATTRTRTRRVQGQGPSRRARLDWRRSRGAPEKSSLFHARRSVTFLSDALVVFLSALLVFLYYCSSPTLSTVPLRRSRSLFFSLLLFSSSLHARGAASLASAGFRLRSRRAARVASRTRRLRSAFAASVSAELGRARSAARSARSSSTVGGRAGGSRFEFMLCPARG